MGSSCDWERERFTMDEGLSQAVTEVFIRYYNEGLIYRGERIVNWCPHCHTSISDAEVEYEEQEGCFWHLRYPLADGSGDLVLATTRPETLLGDTAVAVHPDDERYRHLIGKMVVLPLVGKEIPIVADTYVEKDFGTGVVKITPAHDPNDFEVGLRHNLPIVNIMTEDAHINENGGIYAGMERYEARKRIVADLEAQGYLIRTEPHIHNVGTCYRCGTTVEPRVSFQWFVKMKPLAEPAIEAVRNGDTKFVPDRFDKIYFNWMENIRDWCISRQLWWGHRIPAYYCQDCGNITVASPAPEKCSKCGSTHLKQDEDTLDTWFSSALWPFSTLGWPDKTDELDYWYPTNVLVTSYDIIFFWVARMIFSGISCMGKAPFDNVLIHGIVRDAQGRKMSKSLGNGIDPLPIIDKYGADALRYSLVTGNAPGNDQRFQEEKIESGRNFSNKIWNAMTTVYHYFDNGSLQNVVYGSGAREDYTYTLNNLLSTLVNKKADSTIIDSYSYTYDATHNLLTKIDARGTTTYTYDTLNRLLTVTEPGGKGTSYTYDAAGNRLTQTVVVGTDTTVTTYTYDGQNHLTGTLAKLNGVTTETVAYAYDNNGNQLAKTSTAYIAGVAQTPVIDQTNTYDLFNQLISSAMSSNVTVINTYNGDGLRVGKSVNGPSIDTSTRYLYEYDKVVLEESGSGLQTGRNVYGINLITRQVGGDTFLYMCRPNPSAIPEGSLYLKSQARPPSSN